ncbi:uncharacterized protein LOC143299094 isoform X2 [Babylonia areolata]|uniref:uncharacterized protein LOC143299094 isoform X2 n=1 Tax=Babylonia areolata TaxID=304850 RepID=UPI003FD30935
MIRGKKEGSNYSTWFIGFDHEGQGEQAPGPPHPSSTSPSAGGRGGGGGLRSPMSTDNPSSLFLFPPPPPPPSSSFSSSPSSRQQQQQQQQQQQHQLRPRTPEPSRRLFHPSRGANSNRELEKPRGSNPAGVSGPKTSGSGGLLTALPKWDEDRSGRGQVKKVTRDLYKHAFESARQAEEHKFKAKFDVLLNDLRRRLDRHSSRGLVDSLTSTSYEEVLLSFRGKIKDLLIVFNRRLQLAYESFDSQDAAEDRSQQVKQNVSRFLEDLIGESLDLTSDEAVSDLSSLSDDSSNERHAFEDQLAQAVVSKILETHRREVHHGLRDDRRSLINTSPIPEALDEDEDEDEDDNAQHNVSSSRNKAGLKDTDISKDFQDLKNFVQETQSRSRRYDDYGGGGGGGDSLDGGEGLTEFRGQSAGARLTSGLEVNSREREFESLPDFSDLEQIDFDSGEVDPDLLQMNLAVIPEETEEELEEEEARDSRQWRDNWIFKGQGRPQRGADRRTVRGQEGDQPHYLMVPTPDQRLAPRVGNRDADQLSDLSDNDDEDDDDDTSFYPRTSEELARVSRLHKRPSSPPSLRSTSLIPALTDDLDTDTRDQYPAQDNSSLRKKKASSPVYDEGDLQDYEDVGVGTEDLVVGPIVEPTQKELKLLEDLVPADGDDPRFLVAPDSVTVQEGEPVKLTCRVAGTQPVDVFWYREGAEVEELEEGEDIELLVEGDRHVATLYHMGRQHAGQYMCIALSDQGKAIKYLTVSVKDNKQELKKPEFLKELADVEVLEGQSVKFRCKVKGYPPPRIYWYKDGSLLKSSRACRLEKFGNRDYLLVMDHVTMDDDAEYRVVARNVAGQVSSTAQVIVEPRSEGHPTLPNSQSRSLTTLTTDSDSDHPPSVESTTTTRHPDGRSVHGTVTGSEGGRCGGGRGDIVGARLTAGVGDSSLLGPGGDVVTEEELSIVTQHLDDMERHLSMEDDGRGLSPEDLSPGWAGDHEDPLPGDPGDEDVDEVHMDKTTKTPRRLTPSTLSVLHAAEEIIQQEQNSPDTTTTTSSSLSLSSSSSSSSSQPPRPRPRSSVPSLTNTPPPQAPTKDDGIHRTVSRPSPAGHTDLNTSVSSGYAVDFPDSGTVESRRDWNLSPSPQDEFVSHLPPLPGDEGSPRGGSYREEVSISLSGGGVGGSSSSSSQPKKEKPTAVSSARAAATTTTAASKTAAVTPASGRRTATAAARDLHSSSSVRVDSSSSSSSFPPATSSSSSSTAPRYASSSAPVVPSSTRQTRSSAAAAERRTRAAAAVPVTVTDEANGPQGAEVPPVRAQGPDLVLNFGPKEIDPASYSRDYVVVKGAGGGRGGEEEGGGRKRWSVTLDPYSPTADVVNRRRQGSEAEEDAGSGTPQTSPRSSQGSTISTSRESLDSGVSSAPSLPPLSHSHSHPHPPERTHPLPVHMVGETKEEEVPESRAEYDADSGVELPSVSRLKAMFASSGSSKEAAASAGGGGARGDSGEGSSFRRIHSITARSLSKEQLQKLRDGGSGAQQRDTKVQSRSTIQLTQPSPHPAHTAHTPTAATSSRQQHTSQGDTPTHRQRVRTISALEHTQQEASRQHIPSHQKSQSALNAAVASSNSFSRNRARSPRPKSAVIEGSVLSTPHPATTPRARAQSDSDTVEGVGPSFRPKIRSGCISARAAFWERRILQGEGVEENAEENFPDMLEDSQR